MKIQSDKHLPIGCDVVVTLPGLSAQKGVVRWQHSGCCGTTFNGLLALSELVGWLHEQRESLRQAS